MPVIRKGNVIAVRHLGSGNAEAAEELVGKIREIMHAQEQEGVESVICHDATALESADKGYRDVFAKLEQTEGHKIIATVCAIPNRWLRILASTVSRMRGDTWEYYNTSDAAWARLRLLGYAESTQRKVEFDSHSYVRVENNVVVVRHACFGTADQALQLVAEIESALDRYVPAPYDQMAIYHDATALLKAGEEYRQVFVVAKYLGDSRIALTVCAVRHVWLRILAQTVAMISGRKWEFFHSDAAARLRLRLAGYVGESASEANAA